MRWGGGRSGRGFKRCWKGGSKVDESGQSTLEFAVVAIVVLAVALGLMALARLGIEGRLVQHAVHEASHTVAQEGAGVAGDVLFF